MARTELEAIASPARGRAFVRHVLTGSFGALFALFFIFLNGALVMQDQGLRGGAVFDLMGNLAEVTDPQVGWLPIVGIILANTLVGLVLFAAATSVGQTGSRVLFTAFSLSSLTITAWALVVIVTPTLNVRATERVPLTGVDAWLANASESTVTYSLPILLLVSLGLPKWLGWTHERMSRIRE